MSVYVCMGVWMYECGCVYVCMGGCVYECLSVLWSAGTPGAAPYGGCYLHFNQVEANMVLR